MRFPTVHSLLRACGIAAITLFSATSAVAYFTPVPEPNGTVSGVVDGKSFNHPVLCRDLGVIIDISSHMQTIINQVRTEGDEPAVSIFAMEQGFQIVIFIDGQRYKVFRYRDTIDTFPYTLSREVNASGVGKVQLDLTVECPPL